VRIAAKPVNTNTAQTTSASSGKASGESFLEILMSGAGVGVQGAASQNAPAQGQSDGESSEGDASGDQNSDSNTSQAQASEQAQAATSATAKGTALDAAPNQGTNPQAATTPTTPVVSLPNPILLTKLDPALLVSANGDGAQAVTPPETTATQGKQPGTTQTVRGKTNSTTQAAENDQAQALAAAMIAVPTPAPQVLATAQVVASQAGAVTAPKPATASTEGTSTDPSTAPTVVTPKPQQNAQTHKALDAALSLVGDLATAAATAAMASAQEDAGTGSKQGASAEAPQAAQTSTYVTALLTPKADIASSTVQTVLSQAAGSAVNANQNALHAASALSNALNNSSTTHAATASNSASTASGGAENSDLSSSSDAQSGSGSTQHTQANIAQAPPLFAQSTDSVAGQLFSVVAAGNSHSVSSSTTTGAAGDAATHRAADVPMVSDGASTVSSGGINTARLIQNMNETEMRVGMHSAEFGDISIRTMVSQQQVQAQISVNHSELVNALSAHIPSVQAKMGDEYGLHAHIEVSQNSASFSNQSGQSSQRDQKSFFASTALDSFATPAEVDRMPMRAVAPVVLDATRLDIRA
jgi:hypothetical protein